MKTDKRIAIPYVTAEILRNRPFRYVWVGQGISLLGDQLFAVGLPWLVLQLTGSALATGSVLALIAVPRALFMLLGGAVTDHFNPRVVMLASNVGRLFLVAALSILTIWGFVRFWMLYPFALLFGFADAFFFPAQAAIVPRLVGPVPQHLSMGNALMQGTAQLAMFVGPTLAGLLIALVGRHVSSGPVSDRLGIGFALALDALTFIASIVALMLVRPESAAKGRGPASPLSVDLSLSQNEGQAQKDKPVAGGVVRSIGEGLALIWADKALRYYFSLIALATFLLLGPFSVGIPVLAHTRYAEGAMALGAILSSFGGGSLLGIAGAALAPRPTGRSFPAIMLTLCSLLGAGLVLLGVTNALAPAAIASFIMGCAQGYVMIQWITWLQLRTPAHMLGRTMSVLMFSVLGLAPFSHAVAGALIELNATVLLVGAGLLIVMVVSTAALSPSVWKLGDKGSGQTQRS